MNMKIIDLNKNNKKAIQQAARLLVSGFHNHWPNAWPDMNAGLKEVHSALKNDKIHRIAIDENDIVLGWIGGMSEYNNFAWELHPLVVHPEYQNKGIGRTLVSDFEIEVKKRGGITIYLGTDDEDGMTSLSNTNLYPDVFTHINTIKNLKNHPFEFYTKMGFSIVGVIPDANGIGKPDIIMAKRVRGG